MFLIYNNFKGNFPSDSHRSQKIDKNIGGVRQYFLLSIKCYKVMVSLDFLSIAMNQI